MYLIMTPIIHLSIFYYIKSMCLRSMCDNGLSFFKCDQIYKENAITGSTLL